MQSLLDFVKTLAVSEEISPKDHMMGGDPHRSRFYFHVGRSNIFTVFNVLSIRSSYSGIPETVSAILDFGCGFGRVTRWLRAGFPDAEICVTDRDPAGPAWCAEALGCRAIGGEVPSQAFDLVWVGSVFTHLPLHVAEPLLDRLLASLKPNGVLAITTHGRPAVLRMKGYDWELNPRPADHFHLGRALFDRLVAEFWETGYGYVDYPKDKDYGMCIARGSWYADRALRNSGYIQILFQERADNRQDVSAFMRAGAGDRRWGPLW
jgi:SAM-dependent methyltransferase